jgi:uridine phosphorylase
MGFDPDAPDALDIGPGGVDLLPRRDEREVVTARSFINYISASLQISPADLTIHPWVVGVFHQPTRAALIAATSAQPALAWNNLGQQVWHGTVGATPVTIMGLHIGAPAAITGLEEAIACGGQHFIILGTAGALQADLALGALILPTATIREEGTSFHYVPAGTEVAPNAELIELVAASCAAQGFATRRGPVWTTDAPFRESVSKIQTYRALGILGVEMEAAAMFALAALRGVRLALLAAISDHLGEEWQPAFLHPTLTKSAEQMAAIAVRCVALAQG